MMYCFPHFNVEIYEWSQCVSVIVCTCVCVCTCTYIHIENILKITPVIQYVHVFIYADHKLFAEYIDLNHQYILILSSIPCINLLIFDTLLSYIETYIFYAEQWLHRLNQASHLNVEIYN